MIGNLEALVAEQSVSDIIFHAVNELNNMGNIINEAASKEADIVKSEDSNLSDAIHKFGGVYTNDLNMAIGQVLNKLLEDFKAYVAATVANEVASKEQVNGITAALQGISDGITAIVNR